MPAREEELIIRLLEEERRRRVGRIVETGRINPEDTLVVAVLNLNRRVGNIEERVGNIEEKVGRMETVMATKDDIKDMATKDDIKDMATKSDMKILQWMVGVGLGVLSAAIGALAVIEVLAH